MKILILFSLIFFGVLNTGCKKSIKEKKVLTHTYKLRRPLSVAFLSSNRIEVKQKGSEKVSLKIYLKKDKSKRLIDEALNIQSEVYTIDLPEDLSEFAYIVVVAESVDSNGNKMSAVDTYKIGEQEIINKAKEALKNRN